LTFDLTAIGDALVLTNAVFWPHIVLGRPALALLMRPSAATRAACMRVLQRTVPAPHPLSLVPRLDLLALAARREASRRPDARYAALRAEAAEAAATMVRYFKASQDAYARGHGAHAKALSVHGRVYQRYMEACNRNASEWIYAGAL
jgi:hypothetical protein